MPRALFEVWPALSANLPLVELGNFPTPIDSLAKLASALDRSEVQAFVKRDDISADVYGGNKVRTLEVLFGDALAKGARRIYSTGAYGSNHAVATVLHAARANLESGAILFPQPTSFAALENLRVVGARADHIVSLPHWSALPLGMMLTKRRARDVRPYVMVPGGATPRGALGYVSAAFELARQVAEGAMPEPRTIIIGVGSTCTSAGLLVGFALAARLGVGFTKSGPPELLSVRVTPWPVTSRLRILSLAVRTARLLAALVGKPALALDAAALGARFRVDGNFLGRGYGYASLSGIEAIELWGQNGMPPLDTTYSSKAAAAVIAAIRARQNGPLLFWSTKSTRPLPTLEPGAIERMPARMRRFIFEAEHSPSLSGDNS
jgi:D-cysteine desulfhydrase